MKNKKNLLFYIISIIITLIIIILILFNTIFYDYKGKLNNYLSTYYDVTENNLDDINKLVDRYKNNTNRTNTINDLIEKDINDRVNKFNTTYNSIDDLTNTKDKLINKFNYFFDNISNNVVLINNKESLNNNINNLYNSKVSYLTALNYFNNNNYNDAYNNFINVIEKDSYYEDTTSKIDEMFNNEINALQTEVENYLNSNDAENDETKLEIYKKVLEYITNKKKELSFDISKSKVFNNIKEDLDNKMVEIYRKIANDLANSNKFNEAIKVLNDGINLLNNYELNASSLIEIRDNYNNMEPISLTSLEGEILGSSIKEELAIFDKNNNNYARAISFYKNNTSSIAYNLNGEYKYLTATFNVSKEVTTKNKNYGKVRIYADNNKIYDSGDLNTKSKIKALKLNIKDIKTLKIEYTISNSKSINKDNILVGVLGNPTLEKY